MGFEVSQVLAGLSELMRDVSPAQRRHLLHLHRKLSEADIVYKAAMLEAVNELSASGVFR
jgi:hypothetical protein